MRTLFLELENTELITDYFFSINFQVKQVRLLANYTEDLKDYVLSKGFFQIDYLYGDNDTMFEYKNGNIFVTLSK